MNASKNSVETCETCQVCQGAFTRQAEPAFRKGMLLCLACMRDYDDQPRLPPILEFFRYKHLPPSLRSTSAPFCGLAKMLVREIEAGPERAVALRKLLEAKDAAVRAKLVPGG